MSAYTLRTLTALLGWGLALMILLLTAAFGLAVVSAWFHPELVDSEHAELLAGRQLAGGEAVRVVLAGALPLPAALFALWQGVVLLRLCRRPGGWLPEGASALRNIGLGFAAAVLLGLAAEPLQGALISGQEGFARMLSVFDPCSDSLGLFLVGLVIALTGQTARARPA